MKSIFAAIVAVAAAVSAQTIVTSQPGQNQKYKAGSTAQIVWTPVAGTISTIDLRAGSATALDFVATIATNVSAQAGSYSWNIPATTAPGTNYGLSFGQSPDASYSPMFTITAADGTAPAASSGAPAASSGAPAASSAAPAASSPVAPKPVSSGASAASSSVAAAKPSTSPSAANKNAAAVGAIAVAGAVVAAMI
ncbi:unnamed protein product [Mucor hiemalis]